MRGGNGFPVCGGAVILRSYHISIITLPMQLHLDNNILQGLMWFKYQCVIFTHWVRNPVRNRFFLCRRK